jgi:hypothetical protein
MAKVSTSDAPVPASSKAKKYDEWEVRDAMRTMMRAEEIQGDAKLMAMVKKEAARESAKMQDVAQQADRLARSGHISDKQLAKLKKTKPIAKGSEGDSGKGQTMRGVATK